MRALVGTLLALAAATWIWLGTREAGAPPVGLEPAEDAEMGAEPLAPTATEPVAREPEPQALPTLADDRGSASEGRAPVRPREEPATDDLVVRVVDVAGAPVAGLSLLLGPGSAVEAVELERSTTDVPFEVAMALPDPPWRIEPERRVTDARGEARFEGARNALEGAPSPPRIEHEVAFEHRPQLALDAAALADDVVVSVQPPWCSVEVSVRELEGAAAADGSGVTLELVREGEALDPDLARERPRFDALTEEGVARFPFAEPGRDFEASAARPGSDVRSRSASRASAAAGGLARLAVVIGADHPVVRFRAVDERRAPLREVELTLRPSVPLVLGNELELSTDAAGDFEVDLERGWIFAVERWIVEHEAEDGTPLRGRAVAPKDLRPGLNEGGAVELAPAPLLVAGRVVDREGRPVAGAEVVAGDQQVHGSFGAGNSVRGTSDGEGRFELRGLLPQEEFGLTARGGGGRSEELRVREGERAALLVIAPLWSVEGALVTDAELPPVLLQLELVPADGEGSSGDRALALEGRFLFTDVPEGDHVPVCSLDGEELARIEPIAVDDDVDLGEIDLRGAVTRCEIELVGASEPGALMGEVAWRASGSDGEWRRRPFEGTLVTILAPRVPIDVELQPERHRSALLAGVVGRREHALERALRVRIELATDGALPEQPYVFDPTLTRDGRHVGRAEGPAYFTGENRSVLFLVSSPGPTRVGWHFERRGRNWAVGGSVLQDAEVEIEVLDVPGEQHFRVELDGAALARLLEKPPW